MIRIAFLAAALIGAGASAQIADPIESPTASVPSCPSGPVPGFHHFDHPEAANALTPGIPTKLALTPAPGQAFTPPLNRAPDADSYGGTFPLTITAAGTYRIAASEKAWIDVIGKGVRLQSSAHTHGPDCSGIAKIVDYVLAPGTYQVQLSDTKKAEITVMVAPPKEEAK